MKNEFSWLKLFEIIQDEVARELFSYFQVQNEVQFLHKISPVVRW